MWTDQICAPFFTKEAKIAPDFVQRVRLPNSLAKAVTISYYKQQEREVRANAAWRSWC